LLWKKNCRKLLPIFLQNILYKKIFVTNFVENTCEFYNFVGNNYPWRNYLPIKILRINSRKKSFLANYYKKSKQCSVITINTNAVPQALETDHMTFFCFIYYYYFICYIYIYMYIYIYIYMMWRNSWCERLLF